MSEEEKARRLAEMTGNATVHEEARWDRLANARKRDRAADEAPGEHDVHDAAKFRKVAAEQARPTLLVSAKCIQRDRAADEAWLAVARAPARLCCSLSRQSTALHSELLLQEHCLGYLSCMQCCPALCALTAAASQSTKLQLGLAHSMPDQAWAAAGAGP